MTDTYDTVAAILVDRFKVDQATVTPESSLSDLEVDSLFVVEFSLVLEDRFAITVGDGDFASSDTLSVVADLVDRRRQEAGHAS